MFSEMLIRRFISGLSSREIFTSGDILSFGPRAAVDWVMSKLVRTGVVRRLARGVFTKGQNVKPSLHQIAVIKASRFGKTIVQDCPDILQKLSLLTVDETCRTFPSSGSRSNFEYYDETIKFRNVSARKLLLGVSKVGQTIRALWYLGRKKCTHRCTEKCIADCDKKYGPLIEQITKGFGRKELLEMVEKASLFPAWLGNLLYEIFATRIQKLQHATKKQIVKKPLPNNRAPSIPSSELSEETTIELDSTDGKRKTELKKYFPKMNRVAISYIRAVPLDRRIINKSPDKTVVIIFDSSQFSASRSRRYLEMESIARKYPELAPSKFFVNFHLLLQHLIRSTADCI